MLNSPHLFVTSEDYMVLMPQEATTRLQISAMPTFHVYRNGTKVDELRGADPVALERLVDKYCKASSNPAGFNPL